MLDITKLPKGLLEDIADTEKEAETMSVEEAFDAFLCYNGIIGFSTKVMKALDVIRAAEIKDG